MFLPLDKVDDFVDQVKSNWVASLLLFIILGICSWTLITTLDNTGELRETKEDRKNLHEELKRTEDSLKATQAGQESVLIQLGEIKGQLEEYIRSTRK